MPIRENREYRDLININPIENQDEEYIAEGYATTFNKPYELYSYDNVTVLEQVDSKAFNECDLNDCILQYDHEGRVYARSSNGTLTLTPDEHGLKVRAFLGGTSGGKQLYEEIKGGYINKMSFGFTVEADEVTRKEEGDKVTVIRTITKIGKLYDVSAVSIPANNQTAISARKFSDGVIEELQKELSAKELRNRQIQKFKILLDLDK